MPDEYHGMLARLDERLSGLIHRIEQSEKRAREDIAITRMIAEEAKQEALKAKKISDENKNISLSNQRTLAPIQWVFDRFGKIMSLVFVLVLIFKGDLPLASLKDAISSLW